MISQNLINIEEQVIKVDICYNYIKNKAGHIRKGHLAQKLYTIFHTNSLTQILESDQIAFNKTFKESLNPIYEKIKIFPKKLYICGFCKEYFQTNFSYIGHCLIQECPINHNRSTYNYFIQNSSKYAQNKDFHNYLSKQLVYIIKNNHKVADKWVLNKFDLIKNSNNSLDNNKYYCGQCQTGKIYDNACFYFVYHCINKCQRPLSNKNSHKILRIQNTQTILQFLQDVINITLNFNLLTLYRDSYIKLQPNQVYLKQQNQLNQHEFYCSVCQKPFQNSSRLIEHLVFVCKKTDNKRSSHSIKRIIINSKQQAFQQHQGQQRLQKVNKVQLGYYVKMNPIYADIQDLFESMFYVCGGCGNIFQSNLYLMGHSAVFGCPINHPHSSHLFFKQSSNQLMNQQQCSQSLTLQQKKNIFKENPQIYSQLKAYYKVEQNKEFKNFYCGKCKLTFNRNLKFCWIRHILTKCFCPSLQQNSHILTFQNPEIQIVKQQQLITKMKKMIIHHKIKLINPSAIYQVRKNKKNKSCLYFCGKCEGQFQDLNQLVYHSLSVCESINNKQGSHLITIKVKSANEKSILKIISQQKKYKQESEQAESNIKPRRPNRYQINSQIEKIHKIKIDEIYKIENKPQQQVKYVQNYQDQIGVEASFLNQQMKQLYENINFKDLQSASKYFCGPCQVRFNRRQTFIRHIQECRNFKSIQSSHHYLSKKQRSQLIMDQTIKGVILFKNHPIVSQMLNYIPTQNYYCGCGKTLKKSTYKHHMTVHDDIVPHGSSHIILKTICYSAFKYILFSVEFKVDFNVDYFCPCQPTKKLNRQQFIYHIIKRHRGRSPFFVMQLEN